MKFIVYYTGDCSRLEGSRLPSWRKEYTDLDSIEIFFKKYFEEMLLERQLTRTMGSYVYQIRG